MPNRTSTNSSKPPIKDGNAETLYPRSSFAINCTGDVCKGDVVLFTQKVYKKFGKRTIAGRVVKESYGAAKQQHTFKTYLGIQIFRFYFKCTKYSADEKVSNFLERCKIWSKNSRTYFFQVFYFLFFNVCNHS
ncbi:unnamed protein product [Camellia sinensis]